MAKAAKQTAEEIEFLEAEKAKATKGKLPTMPQLAINMSKVDADGNKLETDVWHMRGSDQYVDTVIFRPLRYKHKFMRLVQSAGGWKTDNESILVDSVFDKAYDAKGGLNCGRVVIAPDNWSKDQRDANYKKANIYGFLFGFVTFPGKEPALVNFRCPQGKVQDLDKAFSTRAIGTTPIYTLEYKLKIHFPKIDGKVSAFSRIEATTDLTNTKDDLSTMIPYIKEIDAFIEAHNANIMARRESLLDTVKAVNTYKEVASLSSDFDDLEPEEFKKGIQY